MSEYVIMPTADYQAACDTIRAATGKSDPIKSGDLAGEIVIITNKISNVLDLLDESSLKYFAFNANSETKIISIYAILYDRIYEATGSYDVTIPDEILGYKVQLVVNP